MVERQRRITRSVGYSSDGTTPTRSRPVAASVLLQRQIGRPKQTVAEQPAKLRLCEIRLVAKRRVEGTSFVRACEGPCHRLRRFVAETAGQEQIGSFGQWGRHVKRA